MKTSPMAFRETMRRAGGDRSVVGGKTQGGLATADDVRVTSAIVIIVVVVSATPHARCAFLLMWSNARFSPNLVTQRLAYQLP